MQRITKLLLFLLLLPTAALAMSRAQGDCMQGGYVVTINGLPSAQRVMQSFVNLTGNTPTSGCTVSVYVTGTGTLANIFADNLGTSLANPFTADATGHWFFYAANGAYDVTMSSAGIAAPFTLGAITLFDINNYVPPMTPPGGADTDVQYNCAGAFCGSSALTWNYSNGTMRLISSAVFGGPLVLDVSSSGNQTVLGFSRLGTSYWGMGLSVAPSSTDFFLQDSSTNALVMDATQGGSLTFTPYSGTVFFVGKSSVPSIITTNGSLVQSSGGFLANAGGIANAFNSATDGATLRGYSLNQNQAGTAGGYLQISPVTYNPYNGPVCHDTDGNVVTQPLPLPGTSFGATDTILWVGTSPLIPTSGSCGAPLPIQGTYGLNTNSYILAMGGLATSSISYNAINTLYAGGGVPSGGLTVNSITMGTLYPAGTVTTSGTLATAQYLGGYIQMGHSAGVPAAGTIATTVNPLTQYDGVIQGTMYWDDISRCANVFNGTAWGCLGSGGGGGTPGGLTSDIQFNNAGSFGGSGNFIWNNAAQLVTINGLNVGLAGLIINNGFIQTASGFLSLYNSFQTVNIPNGGGYFLSMEALNYTQTGAQPAGGGGAPASGYTTGQGGFGAGAIFFNTTAGCESLFNGTSWNCFSTGGATTPGGALTELQFYGPGNTFAGSANMTWNNSTQTLLLIGTGLSSPAIGVNSGFIQSAGGFVALGSSFQEIQAPGGGVFALSMAATNYVQTGNYAGAAPPITGVDTLHAGTLSYSLSNSCEAVFSGSTWGCIGGGGGGGAAGPLSAVQFNNPLGTFAGSGNMEWNNATQTLLIVAANSASPGIGVSNGFIQAANGFVALGTNAFEIQAPNGGLEGLSLVVTNYVQTGNGAATPPLTGLDTFKPGAIYYNTSSACEELYNGSTWNCFATAGGVTALNTFSGSVNIIGTTNQIIIGNTANTITLALPAITSTTSFASLANGVTLAFNTTNGNFGVEGNGTVQLNGAPGTGLNITASTNATSIQTVGGADLCYSAACTGGVALQVDNANVLTLSAGLVNMSLSGFATFSNVATFSNGLGTTAGTNSVLYIGTAGNFYDRPTGGASTAVSCTGIADGWMAITSDDYVAVCLGGARFRAALTAY